MPKSVTRTLRLDEQLDRAVAECASKERTSVNYLVSNALRKLVEWDTPIAAMGIVSIPQILLKDLAADRDGNELKKYGRSVARNFAGPVAEYVFGELSVASAIEFLNRASLYGGRFRTDVREGRDSRSRVIVLRHDQGPPWSMYYEGLLEEVFKEMLHEHTRISCTDSLCIVQIALK